ncbi:hypothetical protein [Companilactobacillus nodensis]
MTQDELAKRIGMNRSSYIKREMVSFHLGLMNWRMWQRNWDIIMIFKFFLPQSFPKSNVKQYLRRDVR